MPPVMPPGAPPPQAGASAAEYASRIDMNERIVARDPKNRGAWVALGNDYFDTHQPQKSVDAYQKALDLDPNDANVLTDQGVMFRELRQFDKAIANFKRATQADPGHVQSLFNMGVVYESDLHDTARAAEAWRKVIQVAPTSSQANDARASLARIGQK
jgi:Tfp pilus assembly protein PilF